MDVYPEIDESDRIAWSTQVRRISVAVIAILLVFTAAPVVAQQGSEEDAEEADTRSTSNSTDDVAREEAASSDAEGDDDGVRAGYDGGFWVESADGNHRAKLSGGFTPRLNVTDVSEPSDSGDELRFLIRRARIKLSGHTFTPRLEWTIQMGLGGSGNARLLDGYIDYGIVDDSLSLYAGKARLPYLREQLTPHSKLQFSERSIVEDTFGEGRDAGIALHNFKREGLEWTVGVYNGTESSLGTNPPADADTVIFEPAVAARIGWSTDGLKGYSEGDVEGGPLRWGVGVSALSQLALADGAERADKVGLDFVLKAHGFSLMASGHAAARSAGDGFFDQDLFVTGARAQVGYVIASRYEPVIRYAVVNPSDDETIAQEARAGFNVFFFGHSLKLQADAGAILRSTPGVDRTDWNGRLQGVIRF